MLHTKKKPETLSLPKDNFLNERLKVIILWSDCDICVCDVLLKHPGKQVNCLMFQTCGLQKATWRVETKDRTTIPTMPCRRPSLRDVAGRIPRLWLDSTGQTPFIYINAHLIFQGYIARWVLCLTLLPFLTLLPLSSLCPAHSFILFHFYFLWNFVARTTPRNHLVVHFYFHSWFLLLNIFPLTFTEALQVAPYWPFLERPLNNRN